MLPARCWWQLSALHCREPNSLTCPLLHRHCHVLAGMCRSMAQPEHFMLLGRLPSALTEVAPWLARADSCAPAALAVPFALAAIELELEEEEVDGVDEVADVEVVELTVVDVLAALVFELWKDSLILTDKGHTRPQTVESGLENGSGDGANR